MNKTILSAFAALVVTAAFAKADPVPYESWTSQYQLMQASGEFFATTYTASQAESVEVTGFYENTDRYNVYVNGSLALTTPLIPPPAVDFGDDSGTYTDPSQAWGSGLFSEGTLNVDTGDVLSIQDIGPLFLNPGATGEFGVNEFDAQVGIMGVPEPGSAAIFAIGSLALFGLRRRFPLRMRTVSRV